MTGRQSTALLVLIFLLSVTRADSGSDNDLKEIMQNLRSDSALIVDGMLVDNFDVVADAANRIANHPRIPPEQVTLLAAELGSEMAAFKQLDTLVHDLSLSIHSAALEADSNSIAYNYQKMLMGCLECHASYRQRVAAVLNPPRDPE